MRDGVAEKEEKNCAFLLVGCREGRNPDAKGRVEKRSSEKEIWNEGDRREVGKRIELRFSAYSDSNSNSNSNSISNPNPNANPNTKL